MATPPPRRRGDPGGPLDRLVFARQRGLARPSAARTGAAGRHGVVASRLAATCSLPLHRGCVNTVRFSRCGRLMASGSDDCRVAVYDWEARGLTARADTGHRGNIFHAVFTDYTGRRLLTCAADGEAREVLLDRPGAGRAFRCHADMAHKLGLLSPDAFLSCGSDGLVLLHDLREAPHGCGTPAAPRGDSCPDVAVADADGAAFLALDVAPDGRTFCVGCTDGAARLYDVRALSRGGGRAAAAERSRPLAVLALGDNPRSWATGVAFSWDGSLVAAGCTGDTAYTFDVYGGGGGGGDAAGARQGPVQTYTGHVSLRTIKDVSFVGARSECVASGSDDGSAVLWDTATGAPVCVLPGADSVICNVVQGRPGTGTVVTSGIDSSIKVFEPVGDAPPAVDLEDAVRVSSEQWSALVQLVGNSDDDDDTGSDDEDLLGEAASSGGSSEEEEESASSSSSSSSSSSAGD